ncbi:MAG TPA: nucleotidyltransferase family protein [Cycloclasticus sp.]|jgi:MurNAc alpha-1-phosphate uridylyltransferase|nr:nucleotidyltransferase family protein [Cycloclasticus sp.]HIL92752.1 nucleotidyltransferase family protein [Cycloclasticus sp.]
MKVMMLAAGRGERMGSLTENCPKPLLKVAGRSLIEHHILALKNQGFSEFVINVAYLGDQIMVALGNGERFGVQIDYSDEGAQALETGGGIQHALPLLGKAPFLVVNADIWTDISYTDFNIKANNSMHLVLVKNPEHNQAGDFYLNEDQVVQHGGERLTYSGVGIFTPALFSQQTAAIFPLAPLIHDAISRGEVGGQLHSGVWVDVGTPQRLDDVEAVLNASQ